MVRVLALYDIHGNIDALDAVLADPQAADPDIVVVGGDAVPGPFARATLARLDALSVPIRWIRGNGEREVAEVVGVAAPADDDLAGRTAAITAAEIGDEQARSLGDLPLTVELDGVLFATPARVGTTRCSPDCRPLSVGWTRWKALTARSLWCVCPHQQDDRVVGNLRFVNAGSVGLPYEGDGAAHWLWVVDGVPELRHTVYDARRAGARILAAGWPDERSVRRRSSSPSRP